MIEFQSRSEYGEDAWIWKNIPLPTHGFYLDIGAGDPLINSNTAFLRACGWQGLAVDANRSYAQKWQAPFVSAIIAGHSGKVGFQLNPQNPGISRIVDSENAEQFPCFTANELLGFHNCEKLDFLSLDIEGAEFDALSTLDLAKYRPKVIVSEYATWRQDGPPDEDYRVKRYLEATGLYREVHRTAANIIYERV